MKRFYTLRIDFQCEREDFLLMQYNYSFFCISIYKRSDYGSQFEPKHVAVNKFIKSVLYVNDLIHVFVALIALLLSLIPSFHCILYYRPFPHSLLFLEYPEDGCGKPLRNIGTYMTYSKTLGPGWTPRKSQISNWCFLINRIFLSYH